jgi:hypothetical protein
VGQHELRSAPPAAEGLAFFVLDALIRIVAPKGPVADEKGADPADQMVDRGVGPRYSVNQDMSSPGPAMKPSSDIVAEYNTLPMTLDLRPRARR